MIRDAWLAVVRRLTQVSFSVIAIAVSVGAVVATMGAAQSAADNIAATLRALNGTTSAISLPEEAWPEDEVALERRLQRLEGVTAAGTATAVPSDVARGLEAASTRAPDAAAPLAVITPGGLTARGGRVVAGYIPTEAQSRLDPTLVVVGADAARTLSVAPEPGLDEVHLGPFTARVVGIVADGPGEAILTAAVGIGPAAAARWQRRPPNRVVVVAQDRRLDDKALAAAADPRRMDAVSVRSSLPPESLRGSINSDTAGLILVLAAVSLLGGAIGVGNTMQTAVWQRRSEIGVLRALGGTRARIAGTFLLEATFIGALGGVLGFLVGVIAGAVIARVQGWDYSLPTIALATPALGVVLGTLAGAWPAWRASRVDPAELLRAD